ncbi:hypothetical protein SAMD00019534_111660, partial [Acytostelium subglobosum LB1]|uniref:hypothetical protein n=1 Tax=Acytostelium subglobosum LB1 TaxID=1410327 RepID=UPI000644E455
MDTLPVIVLQQVVDQLHIMDACSFILSTKRLYQHRVSIARPSDPCTCGCVITPTDLNKISVFHRCNQQNIWLKQKDEGQPYLLETRGEESRAMFEQPFDQPLSSVTFPSNVVGVHFNVSLDKQFRIPIEPGDIPDTVTSMTLGRFIQPLKPGAIPNSVTSLNLALSYTHDLQPGIIPASVKELHYYNSQHPKPGALPPSITKLDFGGCKYQLPPGALPPALTSLNLYNYIGTLALDVLPTSLTHLELGYSFNQVIELGVLPPRLASLIFGESFDRPLQPFVLPESLTLLKFVRFDNPLPPGTLPSSLLSLDMGIYYNIPLEIGSLPASLKSLVLSRSYNQELMPRVLPDSLTHLSFGVGYKKRLTRGLLPASLTSLGYVNPNLLEFSSHVTFEQCHIRHITLDVDSKMHQPRMPLNSQFDNRVQTLELLHCGNHSINNLIRLFKETDITDMIIHGHGDNQVDGDRGEDAKISVRPLDHKLILICTNNSKLYISLL